MKKNYKKPIVLGFLVVYVMSMLITTKLVRDNYAVMLLQKGWDSSEWLAEEISDFEENSLDKNFANYLLAMETESAGEKFNQYSAAVYDKNTGKKIAQTGLMLTDNDSYRLYKETNEGNVYTVGQYMPEADQDKLAKIALKEIKESHKIEEIEKYPLHFYNLWVDRESNELMGLQVFSLKWEKSVEGYEPLNSTSTGRELVLDWQRSDKGNQDCAELSYYQVNIKVPYLNNGYRSWKRWQADEHLQTFPEVIYGWEQETSEYAKKLLAMKTAHCMELENGYVLMFHQTTKPLLEAMNYLKYVYFGGFMIVLACMLKVSKVTEKTYAEREKLEETRRDFTNAIAHELKTPLGVIRGFAENLEEKTNEEKRDYYLNQIVGQTESMDEMIKEMIYISKLDSDKFVLDKKEVSFKKLIDEALESLSIYIEEKQLQVSYKGLSDRVIEGDSQYLKKAIWNLISNAVEYNQQNGQVEIIFEESTVKIRNTGNQIPEEDLSHVFDMFYTGNKSRTSGESHLGLGLYLSKKILNMHGLQVIIGNIQDGVEVVIKK